MEEHELLTKTLHDDDLILLGRSVHDFGERELVPYLRNLGKEQFPDRFIALAAESGFLGTSVPAEFGGHGGTLEGFLPVMEGIAAFDGSLALTLAAHESLATTHVLLAANDEQKRKYLPRLTGGRTIAAWCLTEPQAGSNIFSDMRSRLAKTSNGWILNGDKTFITNGCHADLFVVLARAIGEDGQDAGITACVLERQSHQEGITSTPLHSKMGMCRTDTAAVKFENVVVDEHSILGPVGSAGQAARRVLLRGRIGVAALVLGLARDCLERATTYTKTRMIGKAPLFEQQLTQAKLSQMEAGLWVAWQAVRSAAHLADQRKPFKTQACMAKVFATETALRIADEAIQLLGGYGYMTDYKVEQNYRDARLLTIGEGASEILRLAIARNVEEAGLSEDNVLEFENPESDEESTRAAFFAAWGPSLNALKLARNSFRLALERMHGDEFHSAPLCQSTEVKIADLAARLWIAGQVTRAVARLAGRKTTTERELSLGKSFLENAPGEICRGAIELLHDLGVTDERLLHNYSTVLQLTARDRRPASNCGNPSRSLP